MPDNLRALSNAFAQTPPNELEKSLAEQAKPGHIPAPDLLPMALSALWKLPKSDPRHQLLVKRQVNSEELSAGDLAILFGGNQ